MRTTRSHDFRRTFDVTIELKQDAAGVITQMHGIARSPGAAQRAVLVAQGQTLESGDFHLPGVDGPESSGVLFGEFLAGSLV